ncbi:hypothetical protein ALC53_00037, partial [Atta colombica]
SCVNDNLVEPNQYKIKINNCNEKLYNPRRIKNKCKNKIIHTDRLISYLDERKKIV